MPRVLMVYPEFRSASFWNYRDTCQLIDARYPAAPLGLITVAAMLPPAWEVRLVDRNVENLEQGDLEWADLIFTGGMLPQQVDCLELIHRGRSLGKTVVVGGPDATSSPHVYEEASHLILGEAEVTLPSFLEDLARGEARPVYQDPAKANVQTSPTPRFDLLRLERYNHIGVQWCRGCPFNCEFCDIIELFGRVPRAKTPEQILLELQRLHDLGYRGHVDLVDDNFIGNKKLVKQFLPHLKTWLEERNWPFEFTTEASINLADDAELMRLMREVGFFAIFVGIESPDEETLYAMQKRQNTKRSIAESVEKFYQAGFFVNAGFIIGFDTERSSVARGIISCIEDTSVPAAMVGLLYALPNTQLTRRLATEGRLHADSDRQPAGEGDQCTAGINFDPCRSRANILRDYLTVIETVYAPRSYFGRVARVGRMLDSSRRRYRPSLGRWAREARGFFRMALKMRGPAFVPFARAFLGTLVRNPRSIRYVGALCGLYVHFGPFSRYVATRIRDAIAREELQPARIAVAPPPRVRMPKPAVGAETA
ncbi:MAG TPA: B12-binding domain-containing radical SAM protein [Gemmatimonadales bacterium]|nr:B12-binding domain-containing radical SAM protein [Gemmatimonadales bacterium]